MVLREEFDDWAVLFDPDTGNAFGFSPVSVFIWKHLDGRHTSEDILTKLRLECEHTPEDACKFIDNFVSELVENGLAGYEYKEA